MKVEERRRNEWKRRREMYYAGVYPRNHLEHIGRNPPIKVGCWKKGNLI